MAEPLEVSERGYFWWSDQPVPQGHFAPDDGAYGSLTISSAGQTELELDNQLPNPRGRLGTLADGGEINRSIRGILKVGGEHVFLTKLGRCNASIRSSGLSHEGYRAFVALKSYSPISDIRPEVPTFCGFQIPFSGFAPWFNTKSISVDQTQPSTRVSYDALKPNHYQFADGTMTLEHLLLGVPPGEGHVRDLHLVQTEQLVYAPSQPLILDAVIEEHGRIEDLLVVLTDSERNLDWPIVRFDKSLDTATLYYVRPRRTDQATSWADYWLTFPQIADSFGTILANWRTKRETFGPGFYMYLGTRRGLRLYAENRFMNLMFGLESFHRTLYPEARNDSVKEKIARILKQVNSPRDHKWLVRQLKYSSELPLEERLVSLLQPLPLDIPLGRLRAFAKKCARYRNDIAHFGGTRNAEERKSFIPSLAVLNDALDLLYHMVMLREIGVPETILKHIVTKGFHAFGLRYRLQLAGLLEKS